MSFIDHSCSVGIQASVSSFPIEDISLIVSTVSSPEVLIGSLVVTDGRMVIHFTANICTVLFSYQVPNK